MNDRIGIGGNNPPEALEPFDALQAHIEDLISLGDGMLIGDNVKNQEQADAVKAWQLEIKSAAKDIEEARKAEKKPHDEAGRAVQAKYKPLQGRAAIASETAAAALTPWLQKQEAERQRAAEEKRKEAERLEAEALAKFKQSKSTDLEARLEAEDVAFRAKKATASAKKIDGTATGLRTYTKVNIADYDAFISWLKKNKPQDFAVVLDDYSTKLYNAGNKSMDGVKVITEKRAV